MNFPALVSDFDLDSNFVVGGHQSLKYRAMVFITSKNNPEKKNPISKIVSGFKSKSLFYSFDIINF